MKVNLFQPTTRKPPWKAIGLVSGGAIATTILGFAIVSHFRSTPDQPIVPDMNPAVSAAPPVNKEVSTPSSAIASESGTIQTTFANTRFTVVPSPETSSFTILAINKDTATKLADKYYRIDQIPEFGFSSDEELCKHYSPKGTSDWAKSVAVTAPRASVAAIIVNSNTMPGGFDDQSTLQEIQKSQNQAIQNFQDQQTEYDKNARTIGGVANSLIHGAPDKPQRPNFSPVTLHNLADGLLYGLDYARQGAIPQGLCALYVNPRFEKEIAPLLTTAGITQSVITESKYGPGTEKVLEKMPVTFFISTDREMYLGTKIPNAPKAPRRIRLKIDMAP